MALRLEDVHDLIDSWLIDPAAESLGPANELLATMNVGDPGRIDVLQVIAHHQAMRGEIDAALATLDQAGPVSGVDSDVVQASRAAHLIEGGRHAEADPLLRDLRSRARTLPLDSRLFIAEALEESGRLAEAMRWFSMGLRDLDPQTELPSHEEELALIGRWRVRRALDLPPDHYDELSRTLSDLR